MHLSLSALLPLALLVVSTSAGLVPNSPRTSLNEKADLNREIQRRQVTTADLKRRKNQPKRKRADPSQPVCVPQTIGQNLISNGGFEAGGNGPPVDSWTISSTGATVYFADYEQFGAPGGGGRSLLFSSGNTANPTATGHAEQTTIEVCAGQVFSVQWTQGRYTFGGSTDCTTSVAVVAAGTTINLYSGTPCATDACPLVNGGSRFQAKQATIGPFADPTTIRFTWDVQCLQDNAAYQLLDSISISRVAV